MKRLKKKITSEEFDKQFDSGEDVGDLLDTKKARVNKQVQRINIDFPTSFLKRIDEEAKRIGVTRAALIKIWMAERLEPISH